MKSRESKKTVVNGSQVKSLSHEKEFLFKGNESQFRIKGDALGLDLKEEIIDNSQMGY